MRKDTDGVLDWFDTLFDEKGKKTHRDERRKYHRVEEDIDVFLEASFTQYPARKARKCFGEMQKR